MASLADKHRPGTLTEVVGNERVVRILRAVASAPSAGAWLFEGPSGVGKTSCALALAHAVADPIDVLHYNGGDVNAERVRAAFDTLRLASWRPNGFRVLIVDEADRMTHAAQALFLTALEALPSRCLVLFTSNEKGDFEPRFLSRLKVLHFTAQGMAAAGAARLLIVAKREGMTLTDKDAIRLMREAGNNLRAALQSLEIEALVASAEVAA